MGISSIATAKPGNTSHQGPPEHAKAPGWLKINEDGVELAVDREEWTTADQSDIESIPSDAKRVPFKAIEIQVEAINEAIEAGDVEISKKDGKRILQSSSSSGFSILRWIYEL